jgi:YD repeat-containing protein
VTRQSAEAINGRDTLGPFGRGWTDLWEFNADGAIDSVVNHAPGGSINSSFSYAYNSLYEVATMATPDGTWTYSYDLDGQLIHAIFASTNPTVPSQNQTYAYKAAGDCTSTMIKGVNTAYISNNVIEYTSVGGYLHLRHGGQLDLRRHEHLHVQCPRSVDRRHDAHQHNPVRLRCPRSTRTLEPRASTSSTLAIRPTPPLSVRIGRGGGVRP